MKIRLERDVMAEAVAWAARSLPSRPSVPILAGLMIKADVNGVSMSSFDYETSARVQVGADVIDEGEALVSGRLLADIAKSLPNRPVDFSSDAIRAHIRQRAPALEIRTSALRAGMKTLRQDGIEKVLQGLTDIAEVLAAANL